MSSWINHVKNTQKKEGCSYKQAMVLAKKTYKKQSGGCNTCSKKNMKGNGIVNDAIVWAGDNLPEMHYVSPFYGKHNFTGPFTKYDQRMNKDGTPKDWSIPVNRVDSTAMVHDGCYGDYPTHKGRKQCDKDMLHSLRQIRNDKTAPFGERFDATLVSGIIGAKDLIGVGKKKKKHKKNKKQNGKGRIKKVSYLCPK